MLVPGALAGERLGPFGSGLPVAPPNLQSNLPQVAGLSGEALAEIANMAKAATGNVDELGNTILGLPKGEVQIDQTDTEKAAEALRKLGYAVTRLPEGRLKIQVQYLDPRGLLTTGGIGGSLGLRNPDGTRSSAVAALAVVCCRATAPVSTTCWYRCRAARVC